MSNAIFTLSYTGENANANEIDLYDVSYALIGFQRSLALTTHLVLNGEIITQAPSLKGGQVLARAPEAGSWKVTALVITGFWTIGTAPKDSPLGNLVSSVYDYVISESLGFHVDYGKTLGQQIAEHKASSAPVPRIEQHKLDALVEKCTTAITDIHRPIVKTRTASEAVITTHVNSEIVRIGRPLNAETYEYIHEAFTDEITQVITGRVSSYNSNTFKGRIYVAAEGRPIAFELSIAARSTTAVRLIVASLSQNAINDHKNEWSTVHCVVQRNTSRSGQLKSYTILQVSHDPIK
jgi:hypothetical protein